jgi:hypothetical protein
MFRVQDLGFRVQGLGFRVQGLGCRMSGSGFDLSLEVRRCCKCRAEHLAGFGSRDLI